MGQYYKSINVDNMQHLNAFEYDNGVKLMEHSWIGNPFVGTIESLLVEGGKWFGDRIVWAGDYAADEDGILDKDGDEINLYCLLDNRKKLTPPESNEYYRFLINMDDWEYVDLDKVPITQEDKDTNFKWRIHPLPLLTCEGNGQGGGDFYGEDPDDLVGRWARKRIMVQNKVPKNTPPGICPKASGNVLKINPGPCAVSN